MAHGMPAHAGTPPCQLSLAVNYAREECGIGTMLVSGKLRDRLVRFDDVRTIPVEWRDAFFVPDAVLEYVVQHPEKYSDCFEEGRAIREASKPAEPTDEYVEIIALRSDQVAASDAQHVLVRSSIKDVRPFPLTPELIADHGVLRGSVAFALREDIGKIVEEHIGGDPQVELEWIQYGSPQWPCEAE